MYVALGISHKQNINISFSTSEIENRGLICSSFIQYEGYFPDFADILPSPIKLIIPHTKMSCITKESSKQPTTRMSSTNQTEPKMFSTDQDGIHARVPNDFAKQMSFKFCQKKGYY